MRLVPLAAMALALSTLATPRARAEPPLVPQNGCAGIQLWNYEATEPQCILGLCTPKADARTVADAVTLNNKRTLQNLEWKSQKIDGEPWSWAGYQKKYPPEERIDYFLRFVSFEFNLGPLCQLAKKNGYAALKLSCDVYDRTGAGCFIAAYRDGDTSINDNSIATIKKHRWGPIASNLEPSIAVDWQEDAMSDPQYRTSLYTVLLNNAVNRTYSLYATHGATAAKLGLLEPQFDHCPVLQGAPLLESSLPARETLPSEPSQNQDAPASIPI